MDERILKMIVIIDIIVVIFVCGVFVVAPISAVIWTIYMKSTYRSKKYHDAQVKKRLKQEMSDLRQSIQNQIISGLNSSYNQFYIHVSYASPCDTSSMIEFIQEELNILNKRGYSASFTKIDCNKFLVDLT